MEYNKIIAVTGLPGLYEILSSKSDGAIVRSLDDKTTRFVASRVHNFAHLESIEVYTVRDNVNLVDVLKAMEASAEKLPDEKDNAALKTYFSKVYPDLDFDRVYSSDLKKMVKWFTVLRSNNIEIKLSEAEEAVESTDSEETPAPKARKTAAEKPAEKEEKEPAKEKAPATRKAAPKAEKEEEEKPKAAAKKSAASEKPAASSSSKKTAKEAAPKAEKEEKPKKAAATLKKSADKKKS